MSIKPILFNTEMVKAILDGRKTVTRRVLAEKAVLDKNWGLDREPYLRNEKWYYDEQTAVDDSKTIELKPKYQQGDILWVQETWNVSKSYLSILGFDVEYKADGLIRPCILNTERYFKFEKYEEKNGWNSPYFMPKEAARIWLKVTNVRVERLQDITREQAERDGACDYTSTADGFADIWDSTVKKEDSGRYGWCANPWVWVIEFERCEKPQEVSH